MNVAINDAGTGQRMSQQVSKGKMCGGHSM